MPRFLLILLTCCALLLGCGASPPGGPGHEGQDGGPRWHRVYPEPGPAVSTGDALAFDSGRGVLVLYRGVGANFEPFGDTWEWDGRAWTQVAMTGPTPRSYAAFAYDSGRGRIVLFGGTAATSKLFDETWEWDGRVWTKIEIPTSQEVWTLPTLRRPGSAYDAARGVVVLFGGSFAIDPSGATWETWEYDGTRWRLVESPSAVGDDDSQLAFDERRGVVFRVGGTSSGASGGLWSWNGTTWTRAGDGPPNGPTRGGLAYDGSRGRLVSFVPGSTWEWDGATWTRVASDGPYDPRPIPDDVPELPISTVPGTHLAYDDVRQVIVAATTDWLWSFDGVDWNVWSPPGWIVWPETPGEWGAWTSAAYDRLRDRLVVFGTWEYDGAKWEAAANPESVATNYSAVAYDAARGVTLLFGGNDHAVHDSADTCTWDGSTWRTVSRTGPAARSFHALAYDDNRERVVLFGGKSQVDGQFVLRGDTWEWDGRSWAQAADDGSGPLARADFALAFDADRGRVVLFGGNAASGCCPYDDPSGYGVELDDTWEWDGSRWEQRRPASFPPARAGHGLVYDPHRRRTVLFGGQPLVSKGEASPVLFDDTWEWDGAAWTQVTTTPAPTPRRRPALVYDAARERVLMLGGERDDLWALEAAAVPPEPYLVARGCGCQLRSGRGSMFATFLVIVLLGARLGRRLRRGAA